MNRLLIGLLLILSALPAAAQSDCIADYCGSVPMLGVVDSDLWATDVFIAIEAEGEFWFRLRTAPEHLPQFIQRMDSGSYFLGVYDLVGNVWGGEVDFDGVILFDWASWSPVTRVELLPMARTTSPYNGKGSRLPSFFIEGNGCHVIPRPWHNYQLEVAFQFFNYSEDEWTTVRVDGGPLLVAEPSPVGHEKLLEATAEALGAYVQVCLGEPPPGSTAGFNPDLGLWFIPRYAQFGDWVVSTVW